jgi:saccharopine dehydrogenase-like NADP-dependent oxidoreductase
MKILLMGLGRQGFRILELILERGIGPVDIFDIRPESLEKAKRYFGNQVQSLPDNPLSMTEEKRAEFLAGYTLVLDALPSFHSYRLMLSAIRAGTKMVSVSFLEEDFMALDKEARKKGALVIPDCGGAPGFSHMMAGYSAMALGGAERVVMKVGAIPVQPNPPFYHSLTWSVEDLMEEYIRPAKCRHNGVINAPDPFADIIEENIQDLPLQSFLSDGARSFLANYPDIPFMEERTLRHHGHMDFMKSFREAGFLTREPLEFADGELQPYLVLAAQLEKTFSNLAAKDRFIMQVVVSGPGGTHRHEYNMPYQEDSGVFGLVNSVAVTAAETAAMVLDGTISGHGVFPLELIAEKETFERMSRAHQEQGAMIRLEVQP